MNPAPSNSGEDAQARALAVALRLSRPLARLLIAQGLKYGEAAEVLKRAFVEASGELLRQADVAANVSRISVATGLHRQDVKRLLETPADDIERGRSYASEVYTRWLTDRRYRVKGQPRVLPMRADDGRPSFEELARSISTDVHPRTLREELRRLGLVLSDDDGETLRIAPDGFVPINERAGLLGFVAENVGDHLSVAVGNVLGDTPRLLEQAVYADGLDDDSVLRTDNRVREAWRELMTVLVPLLEEQVAQSVGEPRKRVRIGLYMHAAASESAADSTPIYSKKEDQS